MGENFSKLGRPDDVDRGGPSVTRSAVPSTATGHLSPVDWERFGERLKRIWSEKEKQLGLGFLEDARFITVPADTNDEVPVLEDVVLITEDSVIMESEEAERDFKDNGNVPVLPSSLIHALEEEESDKEPLILFSIPLSENEQKDEDIEFLTSSLGNKTNEEPPILHSDRLPEERQEDDIEVSKTSLGNMLDIEQLEGTIQNVNGLDYKLGCKLGKGGFGYVYEGTRLHDGLKVALKFAIKKDEEMQDNITIPGYPEPLPREVGLQMLITRGGNVPVIIQFMDWENHSKYYVMVLELPSPCQNVFNFMRQNRFDIKEDVVRTIMWQVTKAAEICCDRGVFHRDIKLDNILINPETLEVKIIDFGCGDLLKDSAYTEFMGTGLYFCPEFFKNKDYYARPATVYSLGVLLFTMACGKYPTVPERILINLGDWYEDSLTEECCELIKACLKADPIKRIHLEMIRQHKWFKEEDQEDGLQTPIHTEMDNVILKSEGAILDIHEGNMPIQRKPFDHKLDKEKSDEEYQEMFLFSMSKSKQEDKDIEAVKTSLGRKLDDELPFLQSISLSDEKLKEMDYVIRNSEAAVLDIDDGNLPNMFLFSMSKNKQEDKDMKVMKTSLSRNLDEESLFLHSLSLSDEEFGVLNTSLTRNSDDESAFLYSVLSEA